MKILVGFVMATSMVLLAVPMAHARGGGGGFHGAGGGGGHYGVGGFGGGGGHYGGFEGGGHYGGEGGFSGGGRYGGEGGFSGGGHYGGEAGHYGGEAAHYGGEAGGYHGPGNFSAGHVGLPTDGGFGRGFSGARAGGYAAAGHRTVAVSGSVATARGAAVRNGFNHYDAFGHGWWNGHPGAWNPHGWGPWHAWAPATWFALGAWCGWGAGLQPVYYDYGDNITYVGDQVYYGDSPVCTADQYYQQAATLAQAAPAPDPNADWMPLGVFSLVQGDQTDSSVVFQLAVNKAGTIAGNYYGVLTDTALPVHGSVNPKTQRAAWTVGDKTTTVFEAGIYNLTQQQAPVLVHVGPNKTQQWMLVRLKQPEGQAGAPPPEPGSAP